MFSHFFVPRLILFTWHNLNRLQPILVHMACAASCSVFRFITHLPIFKDPWQFVLEFWRRTSRGARMAAALEVASRAAILYPSFLLIGSGESTFCFSLPNLVYACPFRSCDVILSPVTQLSPGWSWLKVPGQPERNATSAAQRIGNSRLCGSILLSSMDSSKLAVWTETTSAPQVFLSTNSLLQLTLAAWEICNLSQPPDAIIKSS